jgi:hypothetical protein
MGATRRQQPHSSFSLNSFRLNGLNGLDTGYRLIDFSGLLTKAADTDHEKKVRLLANLLSSKLRPRLPVEPVWIGQERVLAVAGQRELLNTLSIPEELQINPEVATLRLRQGMHSLVFKADCGNASKIAKRALLWAIEGALGFANPEWWHYGRRFVKKAPDEGASNQHFGVHPAFYYGIVPGPDGMFELVVDPSVCYVELESLYDLYGSSLPASVVGRRFLYKYGSEWYKIDALGIGGSANKEMMVDPDTRQSITIYRRAVNRWGRQGFPLIDSLSTEALTVAYKTVGKEARRALSDLLFGLPGVGRDEDGEASHHKQAIMSPEIRGEETEEIIARISSQIRLFGRELRPSAYMRTVRRGEVRIFQDPVLRFAGEQEVKISLKDAGRDRLEALKELGAATDTPFYDEQLLVLCETLPEKVRNDFKKRFSSCVNGLYNKPYEPVSLRYEDREARTARMKARAIEKVLENRKGYALLVLPKCKSRKQQTRLHDFLKRKYWKNLQTQCASAKRILSFYRKVGENGNPALTVPQSLERDYRSYLLHLALGYLLVNRKWLWKLAKGTLRHNIHVGIDLYKGVAVFTFVYGDADLVTFHISESERPEMLSADQVAEVLIENLGAELPRLNFDKISIVFHRDGKFYESELRGIRRAITTLQESPQRRLPRDIRVGMVEIHKTSSARPRMYRWLHDRFANPEMGTCIRLGKYEAALATTGEPLLRRGTAHPLYIDVVGGNIDVMDIAHDMYALSHLAFSAPGSSRSLPFTIALADNILHESTPGKKDELWEKEDGEEEDDDTDVPWLSRVQKGGV